MVTVYDKYGVSGSTNYSLTLDGVKKSTITRINGWGLRKFKLSFAVSSDLSLTQHTVVARVKDAKGHVSTYTWHFTARDGTPPVTTSDAVLNYTGAAAIHLIRHENVGVTHTFYRVDNGAPHEGTAVVISRGVSDPLYSLHQITFWSVDAAGNVESSNTFDNNAMVFIAPVAQTIAQSHALPEVFCTTIAGCHGTLGTDSSSIASLTVHPTADLPKIHNGNCFACHGAGVTPSADCATCHGAAGPHGQHVAITSSTNCTTCHTDAVVTLLHPSCETCHNSTDPVVVAAIAGHHDTCEACHGSDFAGLHFTPAAAVSGHAVTTAIQSSNTCFYSPCHTTDVLNVHHVALPGGPPPQSCASCHGDNAHRPRVDAAATETSLTVYVTNVNCSQCHTAGINVHTNPAIPAAHVTTNGCSSVNASFCHGSNVADIHATKKPTGIIAAPGCVACHATGVTPSTDCAHAGCHDGTTMPLNPHLVPPSPALALHVISSDPTLFSCVSSGCHSADVATVHTVWIAPAGCKACHAPSRTPSNNCLDCHFNGVGGLGAGHSRVATTSPASLHYVAVPVGCTGATCHSATEHDIGEIHRLAGIQCLDCHDSGDTRVIAAVTGASGHDCVDCHNGNDGGVNANPNLKAGHYSEFTSPLNVSGHNINGNPIGANSDFSATGVVVKDSAGATIDQEWPLPTASVFWSQTKALNNDGTVNGGGVYSLNPTDSPAVAMANRGGAGVVNTSVGWGSVVTCSGANGCHDAAVGLVATGPHGADQNWVVDQNFPDDWTKTEITSWDPTGMRSIATTMGTSNPYYKQVNTTISDGTKPTVSSPDPAVATIIANAPVGAFIVPVSIGANITAIGPAAATSQTIYYAVYDGSAQADSHAVMATSYARGASAGFRPICMKCHKLANSYQGIIIEGNGRGARDNNLNYIGMSNEAHMEHHNDLITGQANCVSCHVAIPHGWKRPRLLVYESDPSTYKTQWTFTGSDSQPYYASVVCTSPAQDISGGNWGYLGPTQPSYLGASISASSANGSRYKRIGNAIPNGSIGTTGTSGVLKNVWYSPNGIDAGPNGTIVNNSGKTYSSHLEKLSASSLALKELDNGPDLTTWAGNDVANGTSWGKWYTVTGGTGWLADASPNALYTDEASQNNCTACSSAGLTHVDTGGTGEGVADAVVTGRQANDGSGLSVTLPDGSKILHAGGGGAWTAVPFWK